MDNLLKKAGVGIVLIGLGVVNFSCQNIRFYWGAYDPALNYNPEAQKCDAEMTCERLCVGIPICTVKYD